MTVKELIKIIFAYSARKNKPKEMEEYSVKNPATKVASSSGKSKGNLFVSAKQEIMNTINIEVKKKTLQEVYNQVAMCNDLGFPNFQKGEPINNLMREIKRSIKKQKKEEDFGWKDFWEFWPLSIVVPIMLLSIILGPLF